MMFSNGGHMGSFGHGWMLLVLIAVWALIAVGITLAIRSSIRASSKRTPSLSSASVWRAGRFRTWTTRGWFG